MAGLSEIPAVILDGDDLKAAQVSVIENVQREDLNPIEEALAYRTLLDGFHLTQEEVSKQVGKSRPAIANLLRPSRSAGRGSGVGKGRETVLRTRAGVAWAEKSRADGLSGKQNCGKRPLRAGCGAHHPLAEL